MPLRLILRCMEEEGCDGQQVYDRQSTSFEPCNVCGRGLKDAKEWLERVLDKASTFTAEDRDAAIAWLSARE